MRRWNDEQLLREREARRFELLKEHERQSREEEMLFRLGLG